MLRRQAKSRWLEVCPLRSYAALYLAKSAGQTSNFYHTIFGRKPTLCRFAKLSCSTRGGGDPYGNRTRVSAVKGPRPNR